MLRMRRVGLWIPILESIDAVFLQQLLLTLEDPHPNVFTAGLAMFGSLHHVLGLKENMSMISTIYAYLSKQLQVRRSSSGSSGTSGSTTTSSSSKNSNEAALMTSMVQCLTSLPLSGLATNTLAELLSTIVQLLFTPGLSPQARTSIVRFVCDPSRDVDSKLNPTRNKKHKNLAVKLLDRI